MSDTYSRRDLDFLLYEMLRVEQLCERPRFASHDRSTFEQVIDAAATLAAEQFAPHAAKADANEPTFDGGAVRMIPEIGPALAAYIEGGFLSAAFPAEDGGLGLPYTITAACNGLFTAANAGTAGYVFLTAADRKPPSI